MTLRRTVKTPLADGLKPNEQKRLTELASIEKLLIFYGIAFRRNVNNLAVMKQADWALYFHVMLSNEKPTHQLCPNNYLTWCIYIHNISQKKKKFYDHTTHFHLPSNIMNELRPTFKALSDPELLSKCLKGKTQNPNESLNNVIRSRVPKRIFVSLDTLNFGGF